MSNAEKIERRRDVLKTLRETGNVSETARRLGLHRTTVQRTLKRMGLTSRDALQTIAEPAGAPGAPKPAPEPTAAPSEPKPGRTARDYSGANLGDVGNRAADPSDLVARWERLKRN